jgi:hypothetical protein
MLLSTEEKIQIGYDAREKNSGSKELELCEKYGLTQVGGSQTKVDGKNGVDNYSIKNMGGSSTQVHLTTQKSFLDNFDANDDVYEFVRMFCGTQEMFDAGKDRYTSIEIAKSYPEIYDAFESFLNENKIAIIQYIISNKSDITHVLVRDTKKNIEYSLTTQEIYDKCKECYWEILKGGIHLRNKSGKSIFHFQREGKRGGNPNKMRGIKFKNRFNVLWHIHRNLFT